MQLNRVGVRSSFGDGVGGGDTLEWTGACTEAGCGGGSKCLTFLATLAGFLSFCVLVLVFGTVRAGSWSWARFSLGTIGTGRGGRGKCIANLTSFAFYLAFGVFVLIGRTRSTNTLRLPKFTSNATFTR